MRAFRTIYMVEEISEEREEIISRWYAANKVMAEKIVRALSTSGNEVIVSKLAKWEYQYVDMQLVMR